MSLDIVSSTLYSQEQIALLFEDLNALRADRDQVWEENQKLLQRIETKDALIQSYDEENRQLRAYKASVRAIAAIPHAVYGPYSKLAMIVQPDQVTYSAGKHGGDENIMLTSMKQWNMAIGGNEENTNCLARALDPLEATGTITRKQIECPDKRKHFTVEVNAEHFRNPKLIRPTEERPNNGGNKRCPNPDCGGYCKKRINVTYECEKCGIEFDGAMNPLGTPVDVSAPVPQVSTVSQPAPTPIPVDWNTPIDMTMRKADADTFGPGKMKGIYDDE